MPATTTDIVVCALIAAITCFWACAVFLIARIEPYSPKFKWVSTPSKAPYRPLYRYIHRHGEPEKWLVLKRRWRQEYYVVNLQEWAGVYYTSRRTVWSSFKKVTEKFSTLEQAMLYYHLVK